MAKKVEMPGMSQNQIREMLERALCMQMGENCYCWVVDIYQDHIIYEQGERYFQRTWSLDAEGKVVLGDAQEVQRTVQYMPMQAAGQFLAAVGDPGSDDYGFTWQIQICKYGLAEGRAINWPREALVAAIGKYEGARVFCLMDTQHVTDKDRSCGKSVREIVGWVENVRESAAQDALIGDFQILKSAGFLRDMVVDAFTRGKTDLIGFSHDVAAKAVTKMVAGKKVKEPTEIMGVEIDVVYAPTNQGKFLQMVAASGREEEGEMLEKLLAALQRKRPDLYAQNKGKIEAGTITEDEVLDLLAAAPAAGGSLTAADVERIVSDRLQAAGGNTDLGELRLQASRTMVTTLLSVSGLPASTQNKLKKRFSDQVVTEDVLQAAIQEEKEDIDNLTASGRVVGAGEVRANVGRESIDKMQAAMDGLFGIVPADDMRDVPIFTSLRAAYVEMTGDVEVRGYADPAMQRRLQAAQFDTSTFAYAVGNTLYRRVTNDYRELGDLGVSRLISYERNATNFKPLYAIKIAYFGDLPTITPQTVDYPDLGTLSDEQVEFAIAQTGGTITITRAMILDDDVDVVRKIVNRLPRAARRTFAKKIFNPLIANTTYQGDGKAIFHVDHGNLGSAAYSIAAALAAKVAMAKQTEDGSGERFGTNRPVTVIYPSDLFGMVKNVNTYNPQAAVIADANPMFGFFQEAGLIECPFMTDSNDFILAADPNEMEMIEVAYLNRQREPEMFVADNPTVGQFFVADKIQYKIRHEYNAECVEFRGLYKGVVAP